MNPSIARIGPKMSSPMQGHDKANILVIDDDPDIIAGLAKALSAAGYVAHCCRDAEGAIECIRTMMPDLVISDINLNGANGLQLCERLKKKKASATCRSCFCRGADPRHHPPLARSRRHVLPAQAVRPSGAAGIGQQSPLDAAFDGKSRGALTRLRIVVHSHVCHWPAHPGACATGQRSRPVGRRELTPRFA